MFCVNVLAVAGRQSLQVLNFWAIFLYRVRRSLPSSTRWVGEVSVFGERGMKQLGAPLFLALCVLQTLFATPAQAEFAAFSASNLPLASIQRAQAAICRIPDDCIDSKRYPLFMARDVMRVLIEQLQAEGATPS